MEKIISSIPTPYPTQEDEKPLVEFLLFPPSWVCWIPWGLVLVVLQGEGENHTHMRTARPPGSVRAGRARCGHGRGLFVHWLRGHQCLLVDFSLIFSSPIASGPVVQQQEPWPCFLSMNSLCSTVVRSFSHLQQLHSTVQIICFLLLQLTPSISSPLPSSPSLLSTILFSIMGNCSLMCSNLLATSARVQEASCINFGERTTIYDLYQGRVEIAFKAVVLHSTHPVLIPLPSIQTYFSYKLHIKYHLFSLSNFINFLYIE